MTKHTLSHEMVGLLEAVEADRAELGPEVDPPGEGRCRRRSSMADASL